MSARRGRRAGACLALAWLAIGGGAGGARAQQEPKPQEPPSSQSEPDRVPAQKPTQKPTEKSGGKPMEQPAGKPATASTTTLPSSTTPDPSLAARPKKDRDLADKRARQAASAASSPKLVSKVGVKPAPIINIFHRWTEEYLPITAVGPLPPPELQNRLLRDHYTNQSTQMATRLVPALVAAARKFGVARVEIVSGYRHPKYNLILRKKGHQVARDSEHSHGSAVDFRLPGVTTEKLAQWAHSLRLGGVGTYLASQFVHIDVGPIRRWSGE